MEVKFKNAPNVPRLGDARRVPSYAYPNWNLTEGLWRKESEEAYEIERKSGTPKQVQCVVETLAKAGLGNFSQMLRDINATAISYLVSKAKNTVKYLEPGAGVSTVNVYQVLHERNVDLEKIYTILLEPAESRARAAAEEIKGLGLKEEKNFRVIVDKDTEILKYISAASQDVISCVAQIHHHAYLDVPLTVLFDSLKKGGLILIADWHNSMWEHPARVYQALKEDYDWPTKEEDLAVFVKTYPKAMEAPPELRGGDLEANNMIREFWKSYGRIKLEAISRKEFSENDDIWMLEGHRPVEKQIEEMKKVGFSIEGKIIEELKEAVTLKGNPHQLLPTSRILMFTIGVKGG